MSPDNLPKDSTVKTSTAARIALSSGPAAASAEARKNKKKKSSMRHPYTFISPTYPHSAEVTTDSESTSPETMVITPPSIEHSLSSISIPAAALAVDNPRVPIVPYEPSEPSPSPFLSQLTASMEEDSPSPPFSPTPRKPSAVLSALDFQPLPNHLSPSEDQVIATPTLSSLPVPLEPGTSTLSTDNSLVAPPSALIARLTAAAARETSDDRRGPSHNPLDKYTDAKMPLVQDAYPTSILDHIDIHLVAKWESCPGEKLLAQPFDSTAQSLDLLNGARNRIFAAVTEISQSKAVGVAAPIPSENAIKTRRTPSAFLIYNLSTQQRDILLTRYVWASPNITFRVTPLNPPCPDFLFALKDFSIMLEQDIYDLVYTVWNDEDSSNFIRSIPNSIHSTERHPDLETNLRMFIASMYVSRLDTKDKGDAPAPRFNIFANGSLIKDDNTWCRIRTYFANRIYSSLLLGQASTQLTPFTCSLCHSINHPQGLCPFLDVPGWNGPPLRPITSPTPRRSGEN